MEYKIAVSAGEVSGDQHLAEVVRVIKELEPGARLRGMGGLAAKAAGVELEIDAFKHGAAMGFLELLGSLRSIRYSLSVMKKLLSSWRPDLLVIVDYPDFNLRLAEHAKSLGIKVFYYIPPKVWAWRKGRVNKIRRCTDRIAAIFPFEPQFYRAHKIDHVYYVGNPVADASKKTTAQLRGAVPDDDAEERANDIVLLAGSRRSEVTRILIPLLKTFEILAKKDSSLTATVVVAPNMHVTSMQEMVAGVLEPKCFDRIRWSSQSALEVMAKGRIGFLKSGTCNLEAAMMGLPFVCVYSGTQLAKWIVDTIVSIKEYSPVNIIRGGTVPEVIQVALDPSYLSQLGGTLLYDEDARSRMVLGLAEVRGALEGSSVSEIQGVTVAERVARLVLALAGRK